MEPRQSDYASKPHWLRRWWDALRRSVRSLFHCLSWRLSILLTVVLILFLSTTGWLALQLHRKHLIAFLEEEAVATGETILFSTRHSMLENNRQHLAQIIDNVGARENVLALRLVDGHGKVRFSNRQDEIGHISDLNAPLCQGCHSGGEVRVPRNLEDGFHLYSLPSGEGALGLGVPVLNSPECSNAACHEHSPDQQVLGILDLELSTADLDLAMTDAREQALTLALLTIIIIPTIIGLMTWRIVHRPVHALLHGTRRLASGDLSHRIQISSVGDLGDVGEMATSFNVMSDNLQRANMQLEDWNETLENRVAEKTEELSRTRDQMLFAEKMASLGKLAAIVAHEINNPLAGILVYAKLVRRRLKQLLTNGSDKIQEVDENMAIIEVETARCGDIVRNLLHFSRRDRNTTSEPTNLNQILERSLLLVKHQADLQGISAVLDLDPELPAILWESTHIQQVAVALIMNAIEAMPDGGTLVIRSRNLPDQQSVLLEIEDSGIGIPDEVRQKIFEPFFSTKSEGKGTGLGLSVMFGIVQNHNGHVEFDSTPGVGTTFRIYLPVRPGELDFGAGPGEESVLGGR